MSASTTVVSTRSLRPRSSRSSVSTGVDLAQHGDLQRMREEDHNAVVNDEPSPAYRPFAQLNSPS
jgi:hypothetical protein